MSISHQGTVPIVGLTQDESTAFITNIIFASTCLGCLGWEIIISLPFDLQLLRETKWRSILSTIHSLSYYLSRYATLAFIIVYVVINATSTSVANDHVCQMRVSAAATMFVISECSILLVFIMRTLAIWNLNVGVLLLLITGWIVTFALGVMIPANGKGVLVGGYCTWQIQGKWVGISMVTTAVTCVVCLAATVHKLNKRGWKGLFQSMSPPTSRSIDAEDVSRLLVQRTTFFFVIMVISIVIGDVIYFTVDFFAWQLIAVPFYLMISSNLASRIFRRSWKMTHSTQYNMPPSYFPTSWHDSSSGSHLKGQQHGMSRLHNFSRYGSERRDSINPFSYGPPLSPLDVSELPQHHPRLLHYRSDDALSFVEGVFRSSATGAVVSVKSLSLPTWRDAEEKTPAEMIAAESRALRRASEPAKMFVNMDRNDDTIIPAYNESETSTSDVAPSSADVRRRDFGAFSIAETPTFIPRAQRDATIRTQLIIRANSAGQSSTGGRGGSSSGGNSNPPPPFGSTFKGSLAKKSSSRKVQKRPTTDPTHSTPDKKGDNQMHAIDIYSSTVDSPRYLGILANGSPRPDTSSSAFSDSRTHHSIPPPAGSHYKHPNWSSFTMSTNAASIGNATPPAPSSGFQSNNLSRLRDDLALISTRGRLWRDSSAERARMEAMAVVDDSEIGTVYIQASNGSLGRLSSSNGSAGVHTPPNSIGRSHRSANAKKLILSRASEAGEKLSARSAGMGRRNTISASDPSSTSMTELGMVPRNHVVLREQSSRSSFLTSPAIISQNSPSDVWSDRKNFDLDAMQKSLLAPIDSRKRRTTFYDDQKTLQEQQKRGLEKSSNQLQSNKQNLVIRPQTAPSKIVAVKSIAHAEAIDEVPDGGSEDPLHAFRQAVDHDIHRSSRRNSSATNGTTNKTPAPPPFGNSTDTIHHANENVDDIYDNRPRTSRGGSTMNGAARKGSFASMRGNRRRSSSSANERPKTRNGENGSVKPFGFGLTISNEKEVSSDGENEGFSTPLERIDTRSSIESQ